MNVLNYHCRG